MNEYVIRVTEGELGLLLAALRAFLSDFGHDEADVVRAIQALIAKIPPVEAAR